MDINLAIIAKNIFGSFTRYYTDGELDELDKKRYLNKIKARHENILYFIHNMHLDYHKSRKYCKKYVLVLDRRD